MVNKRKMHPLAVTFICALALLIATFIILYAFMGVRYVNDKTHELKFVGRVENGAAVSGNLYYYDGRVATLDTEAKTIEGKNGDIYIGALSGYLPHGKGTLTKADGTIFEGDFYEGYCTGNATVTYTNGDVYIGAVDHEIRDGFGKYIKKDGTVYQGEFRKGEKNGFGITSFSNGAVYIGQYVNSIKEGNGAYLFEDDDFYIGEFVADKRTGRGIYVWSKSEEYSSEFDSLFKVELTDEFKSGFLAYFEGDFTRHFIDGDKTDATTVNPFFQTFENILLRNQIEFYIGEFAQNELSGKGIYQWLSGRVYEGVFENGEIVSTVLE